MAEPSGIIVLYLVLADLQNTVLSAWLVFAERLLYPSYAATPRPWGMTGIDDQAAAGAIMWVPGSIAFLLPAAWIVGQMLSPQGRHANPVGPASATPGLPDPGRGPLLPNVVTASSIGSTAP
jgi:putative membrane protein